MTGYADLRTRSFLAAAIVIPLLLTGCVKGLFGEGTSRLRPDAASSRETTDGKKPSVPTLSPEQAAAGRQVSTDGTGGLSRRDEGYRAPAPDGEQAVSTGKLPAPAASAMPGNQHVAATGSTRQLAPAAAAVLTYDDAVLSEDCSWHGEVHVAGVVTVAPQATLTIEPGAVIRFGAQGKSAGRASLILVYGRIVVGGTREKPVLLTSRFAQPMAGDWRGIVLLGSGKNNLFESCRIEGAETGLDAAYATVTLKHVLFSRCTTGARYRDSIIQATGGGASGCIAGVRMTDSEADLRGMVVAGNRQGCVAERSSLYLDGGSFVHNDLEALKAVECRVKIQGGEYHANGAAIDLASSQGSVSGARISENADYGIRLAGSRIKVYGNEIVRNSGSGIRVDDGRGAAWGNAIYANGTFDLVNSGSGEFMALGNWWGTPDPGAAGRRISPTETDGGPGRVLFTPLLAVNPLAQP